MGLCFASSPQEWLIENGGYEYECIDFVQGGLPDESDTAEVRPPAFWDSLPHHSTSFLHLRGFPALCFSFLLVLHHNIQFDPPFSRIYTCFHAPASLSHYILDLLPRLVSSRSSLLCCFAL